MKTTPSEVHHQSPFALIRYLFFICLVAWFGVAWTATAAPSTVWVDDDYTETGPDDGHVWNVDAFDTLQEGVDAVADGGTVNIAPGIYKGATCSKSLKMKCTGRGVVIKGASPAWTQNGGTTTFDGVSFTVPTDDPTILVNSGTLTMLNCTIDESTGYDQVACKVVGGTLVLTPGNTININGAGSFVRNEGANPIAATGNTWQQDGTAVTDNFTIEDKMFHALDAGGGGLVTWVANNVYVTANSASIQRGISAASAGFTVNIGAGTFTESGQIVVSKNLTFVGSGTTSTVVKPSADTASSGDGRGWWLVTGGVTLNLSNMTLDGTGYKIWQGIRHLGVGTIDHVKFTQIQYEPSGGSYAGTAVAAFGGVGAVDISNCSFDGIGRVGVLYFGAGTTGTYNGNSYTGKGNGNWLDYAVEVGSGAVATITNNTVTACTGVASVDNSTSAGYLVTTYYGTGSKATIINNIVTGNTSGVAIGFDSSDASAVLLQGNDLTGNTSAGINVTGGTVDAGQVGGSTVTGLGISTGGNNFTGYGADNSAPWAIDGTNSVLAFNNNYGTFANVKDLFSGSNIAYSQAGAAYATGPTNVTVECVGQVPAGATTLAGFVAQGGVFSSTVATNISFADDPTTPPVEGTITRTYTLWDLAGNSATSIQTITVDDTLPPTITAPANVTVNADAGSCTASGVNLGIPVANDNCAVAGVSSNAPPTFPVGTTTVTWTVTDTSGQTASDSQTVTVIDNQAPVAAGKDITVALDSTGNASITAAQIDNGSSDNCSIASMTVSPNTFTVCDLPAKQVILSVTDMSANVSTCTNTVTLTAPPAPAVVYVDDDYPNTCQAVADRYVGFNAFRTIQAAINAVASGGTVNVAPGSYVENVFVPKAVTLLGPNAGKAANDLTRTDEAVLRSAVDDSEGIIPILSVEANDIRVDGFTFDGHTPDLGGSNTVGGVVVNGGVGIQNGYYVGAAEDLPDVTGLTVENNRFLNHTYQGIFIWNDYGVNYSGNYIRNNSFDNMWEGFQIYSLHAVITSNSFVNVRRGFSVHQVNTAPDAGFDPIIAFNTVTIAGNINVYTDDGVLGTGIWINGRLDDAPALVLASNVINSPNPMPEGKIFTGIRLWNVAGDREVVLRDNAVYGNGAGQVGVYGWLLTSSKPPLITGGGIQGVTEDAVQVSTYDADPDWGGSHDVSLTLSNASITLPTGAVGVHVIANTNDLTKQAQVTITGTTTINGGATGVLLEGDKATVNFVAASPAASLSGMDNYIILGSNSATVADDNIDATAVLFDGKLGSAMNLDELFATENKIIHKLDNAALGLVRVKANNLYVTTASGSVQRGIDAATAGDTINVAAGTYSDPLNLENRNDLTIAGVGRDSVTLKPATTVDWGLGYGDSRKTAIRIVNSDNFILSGITLDCDLIKADNRYGFLYWNSTGGRFEDNRFMNMSKSNPPYYDMMGYLRGDDGSCASRDNVVIRNNEFIDTGRLGLVTHDYLHSVIENNLFAKTTDAFGYAMEIGSTSTAEIRNNIIHGFDFPAPSDGSTSGGIYVENAFTIGVPACTKNVVIEDNEIYGCQDGVIVGNEFVGDIGAGPVGIVATIQRNSIHDNTDLGILLADADDSLGSSVTATIANNDIRNNGGYGIYAYTGSDGYPAGGGTLNISVANCSITGHTNAAFELDEWPSLSTYTIGLAGNDLAGNAAGVNNLIDDAFINAEGNWWGNATGPSSPLNPGGAGVAAVGTVDFSPWIGSGADTSADIGFQPNPGPLYYTPDHLVFSQQPGNGSLGVILPQQPIVQVIDENDGVAQQFQGAISLAIGANPGSGVLAGTLPVSAVNGTATFTDVRITTGGGAGYTLVASAASPILNATSGTFDIANPAPTLTGISPIWKVAGSGDFTLTLSGSGFVPTSKIMWGASEKTPATFAENELTVLIPNSDIATAGTVAVSVATPAPGGGSSAPQTFTIEESAMPSVVWVDDNWDGPANAGGHVWGYDAFKTIQEGVTAVAPAGTVNVGAGTYVENVTIAKSLHLLGAGTGSLLYPAFSDVGAPDPEAGSSLRGSQMIVVTANDVEIAGLRLDGDNPALTSGVVRHGADLDARNGIITGDPGPWTNFRVHDCVVSNIYLRAIYPRYPAGAAGTFDVRNNTVQNSEGGYSSYGIMTFGGSGTICSNTLDQANGIAGNNSGTVIVSQNVVSRCVGGIHFDNAVGASVISSNLVSDGGLYSWGVWAFNPLAPFTISDNIVTNCDGGALAIAGNNNLVTIERNELDGGPTRTNIQGVIVTDALSWWGYGDSACTAVVRSNIIRNFETGVYIYRASTSVTASGSGNSIAGGLYCDNTGSTLYDFSGNWWDDNTADGVAASIVGTVDYTPWLDTGTDTSADTGFQGDFAALWVGSDSPQTGTTGRVQEGVNLVTTGGTVNVAAGTYQEQLTVARAMTVNGGDGAVLDGTGLAPQWTTGIKVKSGNVTINNLDVTKFTQDGIICGYEASIPGNLQNIHITNCKVSDIKPGYWGFGIYVGYEGEAWGTSKLMAHLDYSGLLIENNEVVNTACSGVVVQSITASSGQLAVRNNYIHNIETNDAIWIEGARNVLIENNVVADSLWGIDIMGPTGEGWYVLDGDYGPQNITVQGNYITNNTEQGIAIYNGWPSTFVISGNYIAGNGTSGFDNFLDAPTVAENNWWGSALGPTYISNPGGNGDVVSANVDFSPWLGDGTDTQPAVMGFQPSLTPLYYTPDHLVFSQSPGDSVAGAALSPQPIVQVIDENGGVATQFGGTIDLVIGNNPSGGTLTGSASILAVNGVATFAGLAIDRAGAGYTLAASTASPITAATSTAFDISNVLPTITSLSPSWAVAGDSGFTLTINGSGFAYNSVVQWNGADRTTTNVSSTQLTIAVSAGDIAGVGSASVTVVNGAPGGGESDPATFDIKPVPMVVWVDNDYTSGGANDGHLWGYDAFATIQSGLNRVAVGGTVNVLAGTYVEDVNVSKRISLLGAGYAQSTISGAVGGGSATVQFTASGALMDGFNITREGNNLTDWNNPGLNSAGAAIQGLTITGVTIRNCRFEGNRTAIDINNSNGHIVSNNLIVNNRTGMIMRNQTDNLTVTENEITGNWTVGVLFLDASSGSNVPIQSAANCTFGNNNISGNWYGQIVDRQTGSSLPAPGANLKNFSGNWLGTTAPVISTAESAEPGYSSLIPVLYGGTSTPPTGQPDICGAASANVDFTPMLAEGTDTDAEMGFQGDHSTLLITAAGPQSDDLGRLQEGVNLIADGSLTGGNRVLDVLAGAYVEDLVIDKPLKLLGPNAAVAGCGERSDEAILYPATIDVDVGRVIDVAADHVTIAGLEINGDNPDLTSERDMGDANVDTSTGIQNGQFVDEYWVVGEFPIQHLTVENNVFANFTWDGIYVGEEYGTTNGWIVVRNNQFQNVSEGAQFYAVHADFSDNCAFNSIRLVGMHQVSGACDPAFTPRIANNTLEVSADISVWEARGPGYELPGRDTGLWVNGRQGAAPPLVVSNNTINVPSELPTDATFSGMTGWQVVGDRQLSFVNNTVNGNGFAHAGFVGWGLQSSVPVTLTGGALNGILEVGVKAVNLHDSWGDASTAITVDGVPITLESGAMGVQAYDDPGAAAGFTSSVIVKGNTSITGGAAGVVVTGADASATVINNNASITGNEIGIDVNGGKALVENNDLTDNGTAAIQVQNGGIVDAGDCAGGNVTGLGTGTGANGSSVGLNKLTGYLTGDAKAVINSDGTALAYNNNFGAAAGESILPALEGEVLYSQSGGLLVNSPLPPITVECVGDIPDAVTNLDGFVGLGGVVSCRPLTVTSISTTLDPGPYEGTITRTYTLTDVCGQTATAVQVITVDDTMPPTIAGPANVTVNADVGQCYASGVVLGIPDTHDNCQVASVVNDAPAQFLVGSTTVTWVVTDTSGLSATNVQTVTVLDIQPPVVTCPAPIVTTNQPGQCGSVVTFLPSATDNCGVATLVATPASGSFFDIATHTVVVVATDIHGNSNTNTFTVTVNDVEPPSATCPADIVQAVDAGADYATVAFTLPANSDNCGVASVVSTPASPHQFSIGTNTVDVLITDIHGNTNNCSFTVAVIGLPTITSQPLSRTNYAGTTATFSVTAESPDPLSYRWNKNGSPLSDGDNISGALTATLTITGVSDADHAAYTVDVSNRAGTVTSDPAALTVFNPPIIVAQPLDRTNNAATTATFTVALATNSTPPFAYQWFKDGTNVLVDGGNISGANTDTLTLTNVLAADEGEYSVSISNEVATVISSNAVLTVIDPYIVVQPAPVTAPVGDPVMFSVTAAGTETLNYQWQWEGIDLPGETNSTLTIDSIVDTDAGEYTVVVENDISVAVSEPALLTITHPPVITAQPVSQLANEGDTVIFEVSANGTIPFSYQWSKGTDELTGETGRQLVLTGVSPASEGSYHVRVTNADGVTNSLPATLTVIVPPTITLQPLSLTNDAGSTAVFTVTVAGSPSAYAWFLNGTNQLTDTGNITGATSNVLTLTNVLGSDAGVYSLVASNRAGIVTSSNAVLTVNDPVITGQPVDLTVNLGDPAGFTVAAYGTEPTYQWRKGGEPINGATSPAFEIEHTTADDAGQYDVVVSNQFAVVISDAVTLSVTIPPTITVDPASLTRNAGQTAVFTVAVSGTAPFAYQWRKGALDLDGATNDTLTLTGVSQADAAGYSVFVSNPAGSDLSEVATLTVIDPPVITVQPLSRTNDATTTASFSVTTTGSAPTYQWFRNQTNLLVDGGNISGATSSMLTVANVLGVDRGEYSVVVSNAADVVTSSGAVLSVVDPAIFAQPVSQTNVTGGTVVFSVTAAGTAPLSYQWRQDGGNLFGKTASTLLLTNISSSDAGAYTVVITNSAGSITSAPAFLVTFPPLITAQPADVTVNQGQSASFSVSATGQSPFTYQWQKDAGGSWTNVPNATNRIYTIGSAQGVDAGNFRVIVGNPLGSETSHTAVLTVIVPPMITTQPASQTNAAGESVTFNVGVAGSAPFHYQWRKDAGDLTGETNAALVLLNITGADAGNYSVVVTNAAGIATSLGATLTVVDQPRLTIDSYLDGNATLSLTATPGYRYSIRATTNFISWESLHTNAAPYTFIDTNAANFDYRFYRGAFVP